MNIPGPIGTETGGNVVRTALLFHQASRGAGGIPSDAYILNGVFESFHQTIGTFICSLMWSKVKFVPLPHPAPVVPIHPGTANSKTNEWAVHHHTTRLIVKVPTRA